ncbi:hypothetical protein CE91St41_29040 [Oscillospiraceae bacterium]|nr:hypothetical protein CE91St40_29040 [Oscillospiraceae bacterium]BDF76015.1 hypothetical protein CE91St41_29040 [Oscillospiraceae bacterium]
MKRTAGRLSAALLAAVMLVSLSTVPAAAEGAAGITVEGNTVYANGVSIVVKKDADGKTYIYDGAGEEKLHETGFTSSLTVYGGGKNTDVVGDTHIVIKSVSVGRVFGGGFNGNVQGNTNIEVENDYPHTITVYGGGYSDGSRSANVSGNTRVFAEGSLLVTAYGGGYALGSKGNAQADVVGTATLDIPALVPINMDGYQEKGHNLYGGGYAQGATYSAQANTKDVTIRSAGPIHNVHGGGSAVVSGTPADGLAVEANCGAVDIRIENGDIRNIYGGGYASKACCTANAASVKIETVFTETMSLVGGGSASGGNADVAGSIDIMIKDSPNLYAYVYGGGDASGGGSANVGDVQLALENCRIPMDKDIFDRMVSALIYGGGEASGVGSEAKAGKINVVVSGGENAGQFVAGGDAGSGGSAATMASVITISGAKGSTYDGSTYYPDIYGRVEDNTPVAFERETSSLRVGDDGTKLNMIYGIDIVDLAGNRLYLVEGLGQVGRIADSAEDKTGQLYIEDILIPFKARIGDICYASVSDAVEDAGVGATILMLDNVTENISVPAGADITLEGGGHTLYGQITAETAGGAEAVTNLSIQNLTLDGRNALDTAIISRAADGADPVELNLAVRGCTVQNYTDKGISATNAKRLTADNSVFGGAALDLNVRGVTDAVYEIKGCTFAGDFGADGPVSVAQRGGAGDADGSAPGTVAGLAIKDCDFSGVTGGKSDVMLGAAPNADGTARADSHAFPAVLQGNRSAVRVWTRGSSAEEAAPNILPVPAGQEAAKAANTALALVKSALPEVGSEDTTIAIVLPYQGEGCALTAAEEGARYSYQWQTSTDGGANWSPLEGSTERIYTISPALIKVTNSGWLYRCNVGNQEPGREPVYRLSGTVTLSVARGTRNAPTSPVGGKESITGVDASMQYSADQGSWLDCTGAEVTGLTAGTYYVRYAGTEDYEASAAKAVTVTAASGGDQGGGGGGGGSTPTLPPTVETNPDGSTTKTETAKDGTVTETTEHKDGTVQVVETKPDGTVTESVKTPDGLEAKAVTSPEGKVEAEVTIPAAKAEAGTVELPISALPVTKDAEKAPVVTVKSGKPVTVAVPVAQAAPGMVAVIVNADGTEEIVTKSVLVDGALVVPLEAGATVKLVDKSVDFADAAQAAWAGDAIAFVSSHELFQGTGEGSFSPNQPMNRAMLVTVLHRLERKPQAGVAAQFADVSQGAYYTDAVAWASESGIVTGTGAGFDPEAPISREQLATILYRYMAKQGVQAEQGNLNAFTDGGAVSPWAQEAMGYAVGAGLMTGKEGGALDPQGTATRAEVAVVLRRLVEAMAQ